MRAVPLYLLVLFLLPDAAYAEQLSLVLNGKSIHVDADYDWNEANRGLGFEYQFRRRGPWVVKALASQFEDSNRNNSVMTGVGVSRRLIGAHRDARVYLDAGLVAFAMSRKSNGGRRLLPGVLPAVSVGTRNVGLNLTYIPEFAARKMSRAHEYDPGMGGIVFVQARISLDLVRPRR
ncbi:MAG: hypothetical protein AAGM16_04595 [Pseudomonadota bacterium]